MRLTQPREHYTEKQKRRDVRSVGEGGKHTDNCIHYVSPRDPPIARPATHTRGPMKLTLRTYALGKIMDIQRILPTSCCH